MASTTDPNTGKVYDYEDRYTDPTRTDGRKNGNKKSSWQVAAMWDKHHEIARRVILGQKNTEIAEALNCTAQQISNVKNSPVVQDKLSIMRAARDAGAVDLAKEIQDLAPIALRRLKEVLETGTVLGKEASAANILKEANGIMDREQGKAIQRVDTRSLHGHFTVNDIDRIKQKAQELSGAVLNMGDD